MARIGEFNQLAISRESDIGLYLDGGEHGEILLPSAQVPVGVMPYHTLQVFLYFDTGDRLIATTRMPYVTVGTFAYLEVVDVHPKLGAFLDWGLPKNLLLPFGQMEDKVVPGQGLVVTVLRDPETDRLAATTRIRRLIDLTPAEYEVNEAVDLLVLDETDLGYNAIVNHRHRGLLYHSELAEALDYGATLRGYVARVREDGKIDLRRDPSGISRKGDMAEKIFAELEQSGGFLPFNDHSSPASIRDRFSMSKKAFKQGIAALYRQRRIQITERGIQRVLQ
ncbi:MAG: S1-like domain-containing RNA-binding protein [Puniceicoccaceae bacterium]